jgi:G:T/U-mismatch repair DNA glycosylase
MMLPSGYNVNAALLTQADPLGQSAGQALRRGDQATSVAQALQPTAAAQGVTAGISMAREALAAQASAHKSAVQPLQWAQAEMMAAPSASPPAQQMLEKHLMRARALATRIAAG